jgi:hypothetical protein
VDESPRSAIAGVLLQILAAGLAIMAYMVIPHRARTFGRSGTGRRCVNTVRDVSDWLTQECRPGDHRAFALAAAIGLAAILLFCFGRKLAKRAGID